MTYEDRARDISEAIRELARATDREGAATERLVAIREQEVAAGIEAAAKRLEADALAKSEIERFSQRIEDLEPGLTVLTIIAKALLEGRQK